MKDFENVNARSLDDFDFSPEEFVSLLFDRTDEDGVLYTPSYFVNEESDFRCRVNWSLDKRDALTKKLLAHLAMIEKIAPFADEIGENEETAKRLLKDLDAVAFWKTYIRALELPEIDYDRITDISDRMETVKAVRQLAERLAKGEKSEKWERDYLAEYVGIEVSAEDEAYYDRYVEASYREAENRVGKNICAHDLVVRSMRLCRLISLNAPAIIKKGEMQALTVAMLLHEYGTSRETVSCSFRRSLEAMEQMTDEELDEFCRPKKVNSRKSLAPLFVYLILKEKSGDDKRLRQQDILEELKRYPYEIILERKALSRIIHNLEDSELFVHSDKSGVWMDAR